MAWMYLVTAGLAEIGWPVGLKWAQEPGKPIVGVAVAIVSMAEVAFMRASESQPRTTQKPGSQWSIASMDSIHLGCFIP